MQSGWLHATASKLATPSSPRGRRNRSGPRRRHPVEIERVAVPMAPRAEGNPLEGVHDRMAPRGHHEDAPQILARHAALLIENRRGPRSREESARSRGSNHSSTLVIFASCHSGTAITFATVPPMNPSTSWPRVRVVVRDDLAVLEQGPAKDHRLLVQLLHEGVHAVSFGSSDTRMCFTIRQAAAIVAGAQTCGSARNAGR